MRETKLLPERTLGYERPSEKKRERERSFEARHLYALSSRATPPSSVAQL